MDGFCYISTIFSMAASQIYFLMSSLILVLQSLMGLSIVHEVIPDSTSFSGHRTLNYYQDNRELYFTSNTQLHFMPGIFLIKSLLTINNVTNFSLVGSTSDDTVLTCNNDTGGVLITHSDGIRIKDIEVKNCSHDFSALYKWKSVPKSLHSAEINLMMVKCTNVVIYNSLFFSSSSIGLFLYNLKGNSSLHNVHLNSILLTFDNVKDQTYVSLTGIEHMKSTHIGDYVISIIIGDHSSSVVIIVSQMEFKTFRVLYIYIETCKGKNYIGINDVLATNLTGNSWPESEVVMINFVVKCTNFELKRISSTQICLVNSHFTHICGALHSALISIIVKEQKESILIGNIKLINATFSDIQKTQIVTSKKSQLIVMTLPKLGWIF